MALSKINPTNYLHGKNLLSNLIKKIIIILTIFLKKKITDLMSLLLIGITLYLDFSKNRLSNNSFKLFN